MLILAGDNRIFSYSQMQEHEFRYIETEEDAQLNGAEIFSKLLAEGNDKNQKEMIHELLDKINENLKSAGSSPASKYCSLLVLRDVSENCLKSETKLTRLFNALLNHELLKTMESSCENIDPLKPVRDKGKSHFKGVGAELGNDFVRLQLELVKYLASKFQKNKTKETTNFMKTYNKLFEKGVKFPDEYKFITIFKEARNDNPAAQDTNREHKTSVPSPPAIARCGPSSTLSLTQSRRSSSSCAAASSCSYRPWRRRTRKRS